MNKKQKAVIWVALCILVTGCQTENSSSFNPALWQALNQANQNYSAEMKALFDQQRADQLQLNLQHEQGLAIRRQQRESQGTWLFNNATGRSQWAPPGSQYHWDANVGMWIIGPGPNQ